MCPSPTPLEPSKPSTRPRCRFLERAYRAILRVAAENASPWRLLAACVVGGMLGATPLFGLHFILCMGAAVALRLNKVVVYAAANISIPPLAPFVAVACIEVGTFLRSGHAIVVDANSLSYAAPWRAGADVFVAWLVGAPIVGGLFGITLGVAVFATSRIRSARARAAMMTDRSAADAAFAQAQARVRAGFHAAPPGVRHYVAWKMRLDPAYRIVQRGIGPDSHVVELGTGLGLLPMLLVLTDPTRRVTAVDWDARKIAYGREAAKGLPCALDVADLCQFMPPACDAIVLLDVLHYFELEDQRAILARAIAALPPGGLIFVREADRGSSAGSLTRALEKIAIAWGWNRGARPPRFRPIADIVADLKLLGVTTTSARASSSIHPGNAMIVGTKRL
jgi:uncharacterized protein (DUF2062 family)/2-polyprenyl-3-methyl-5-hydroxy-6-metoxy-1,4-benzoquinol methylase